MIVNNDAEGEECSGTLIAPQIVLTAAHCFFRVAQGCEDPAYVAQRTVVTIAPGGTFRKSDVTGNVQYRADTLAIHPRAYAHLNLCAFGTPFACSSSASNHDGIAIDRAHDLAMIHFFYGQGQPPSSALAAPVRLLTGINDSNAVTWGYHHQLDVNADFGLNARTYGYVAGWGNDDFVGDENSDGGSPLERHLGPMVFEYGNDFDNGCSGLFNCYGNESLATTCTLGAPRAGTYTNQFLERLVEMQRTTSQIPFDGPMTDHGDSGGPLTLHAGNGVNDVHDLPAAPVDGPANYFVFGVDSSKTSPANSSCDANADGLVDPPGDCRAQFAPTFDGNGAWIEQILGQMDVDIDGDGVYNYLDNCPTVSNANQANTNLLAEQVKAAPEMGDACDPTPTTDGETGVSFTSTTTAPCVGYIRSGNYVAPLPGGTCPETVTSGIVMNSFIGQSDGDAPAAIGGSRSSFCSCPFADTTESANCYAAPYSCVPANDRTYPYAASPEFSLWKQITAYNTASKTYDVFPQLTTLHQDPTVTAQLLGNYDPNASGTNVFARWDFLHDRPEFGAQPETKLTGFLWNRVLMVSSLGGLTVIPVDLADHYLGATVSAQAGMGPTVVIPEGVNRWNPWKQWFGENPAEGVSWVLVANERNGSPQVFAQRADGTHLITSQFTSAATSAMSGLADGTKELIVGDDVAGEQIYGTTAATALLVEPGTVQIDTALSQQFGRIDVAVPQAQSNVATGSAATSSFGHRHSHRSPTAVWTRAFASTDGDGFLYWIDGQPGDFHLNALDVQQAISGNTDSNEIPLSGAALANPRAMAWDLFDRALYVVEPGRRRDDPALRLLRIRLSGEVTELWRLDHGDAPDDVALSVTLQHELILSVANGPRDLENAFEVLVLDSEGQPLASTRVSHGWMGRVVGNANGLTIGFDKLRSCDEDGHRNDWRKRHRDGEDREGDKDQIMDLQVEMLPRSQLAPTLCGTRWFRSLVSSSAIPALGNPADCMHH